MREKSKLETLLEKLHINLYDYNGKYEELEIRSFEDVIGDLAKSWEALNDDYKDELYVSMGIIPSKPKPIYNYPVGVKQIPIKDVTGVEYWVNQPTCKDEVK